MALKDLPKWVKIHKTKGTEIRFLKGHYYLYQITSQWDKELKRSRKKTLAYLGKITPHGLQSPHQSPLEIKASQVSIKSFGASQYLHHKQQDIVAHLQLLFPAIWQTLFVSACLRLLYQSPLKNMLAHYRSSYLSELYLDTNLNATDLSQCLARLGTQRDKIVAFFRYFQLGNEFVLIDGTSIHTKSKVEGMAQIGHNSRRDFSPQINAIFIFSHDEQLPIYYRIVPGDIREITAMKQCIIESGLQQAIIVSDKGFYSQTNIKALLKETLFFTIPLKRNNKLIDYSALQKGDKTTFEGHFFYQNRPIWYCSALQVIDEKNCYLFLFFDHTLYQEEQKDFLQRVAKKRPRYTLEQFHKKQHTFGTIALLCFLPQQAQAQQAFEFFKSRNEVETMIDAFKNILKADRTYMRTPQQMEGWMFINHLALIFYYRMYKELQRAQTLDKISVMDALTFLNRIYKMKINQQWVLAEVPKNAKLIADKIKLPIT